MSEKMFIEIKIIAKSKSMIIAQHGGTILVFKDELINLIETEVKPNNTYSLYIDSENYDYALFNAL